MEGINWRISQESPEKISTSILAFLFFEKEVKFSEQILSCDKKLNGGLKRLFESGEFTGKEGEFVIFHTDKRILAERIGLIGLGERKKYSLGSLRLAGGTLTKIIKKIKVENSCIFISETPDGETVQSSLSALLEGVLLSKYSYGAYKKEKEEIKLKEITFLSDKEIDKKTVQSELTLTEKICSGVNFARDLSNAPSNEVVPSRLADIAMDIGSKPGFTCKVIELEEARKSGMGAFYGVAKGSREPAKFIVLEYKGKEKKKIAIIGKGITFDSGGISLKPAKEMWEMKSDMSGAANVLAIMKTLPEIGSEKNVLGIIPATENMPGGGAQKPGDVVRAMNGVTIEIISTDAEGRMILADSLVYAEREGAEIILDFATLTGGIRVALGDIYSGVMGNDEKFIERFISAGKSAGEKFLQFPLDPEYKEYIKSEIADIINSTEHGKASPIIGGTFLNNFIEKACWVHIDIAGTAFIEREIGYLSKGATGAGIRTFLRFLPTI